MNNQSLVSIITPVYNLGKLFERTIESVMNQSYHNWELIIIDDCSNDNETIEIISNWEQRESRIKAIYLDENVGAGVARNKGLDVVSGVYLAFLDSDDLWESDKLRKQVEFLDGSPETKFTYSWYSTIDENDKMLNHYVTPKAISRSLLKFNNYILTSTVICRWETVEDIRFPEIRRRQDWAYFLEILEVSKKAICLPESLVLYRKMSTSLSANRWKLIVPNFKFFRDFLYEGNSILAAFHFVIFLPFYFHNKVFNKKKKLN